MFAEGEARPGGGERSKHHKNLRVNQSYEKRRGKRNQRGGKKEKVALEKGRKGKASTESKSIFEGFCPFHEKMEVKAGKRPFAELGKRKTVTGRGGKRGPQAKKEEKRLQRVDF